MTKQAVKWAEVEVGDIIGAGPTGATTYTVRAVLHTTDHGQPIVKVHAVDETGYYVEWGYFASSKVMVQR